MKSPLQPHRLNPELARTALNARMMSDLIRVHDTFIQTVKDWNGNVDDLKKLASEIQASHAEIKEAGSVVTTAAEKVVTHAERIQSLAKGNKGDDAVITDKHLEHVVEMVLDRIEIPSAEPGKDAVITKNHLQAIADIVVSKIGSSKSDDSPIDHNALVEAIAAKLKEDGVFAAPEHVAEIRNEMTSYRNQLAGKAYGKDTWARGGGDTVAAGTGISVTKDANGKSVITNTASAAGTNVFGEVVSGSGTAWTLANIPTTGTLRLFANGQRLTQTVDYTLSGANITTLSSWAAGTLLADYIF